MNPHAMTSEQLQHSWETLKKIRQFSRTNLLYLCREVLGYKDVSQEVHGEIIDTLQKFKGGTEEFLPEGKIVYTPACSLWELEGPRNTLILFPRGHLKTTIITQAHAIQWILNYPNIRILISTATGEQCVKMVREIKGHFQFNNKFRGYFPEYCPAPKRAADFGSQDEFSVPNRTLHRREPTLCTCSVGKVIAGSHYEVIKNSDLVDKENVKTPNQIADVISHFGYLNPLLERSEVAPFHGWTDVEGTRYDFGDLYGRLIDGGTYKTLVRPRSDEDSVWPARFPESELKRIEKEIGPYIFSCTPAESPVLMGDLTTKPICDVAVGDKVFAFTETAPRWKRRQIRIAEVTAKHSRKAPVLRFTLSDGRVIRSTKDHPWLVCAGKSSHYKFGCLGIGRRLCDFIDIDNPEPLSKEQAYAAAYLAGIFDGEGHVTTSNIFIAQSPEKNPEVCRKIEESFRVLGIPYGFTDIKNEGCRSYFLKGGRSALRRFALLVKPAKMPRIIKALSAHRGLQGKALPRVVSIDLDGEETVYSLETTERTYFVWGLASHNCQYKNKPIPPEGGLCDASNIVFLSRRIISDLQPMLRLHCTIDLHGMEPASNDNDFTVLNVHGFDRDGRLYVVDIRRGRFTPDQVIWHVFDIHARFPRIVDYKIEKDAHARVLLPFLQREASKRQRFPTMVPIKRDTHTSKQQRIKGLQPWFKSGIIRFADDLACKSDIILEIMQFPSQSSGVHDDILDTLADAMQNQEGGVTDDVVSSQWFDPREIFGHEKPRDRFNGFNDDGSENWLYDSGQKAVRSPTGVM
jgi:predicted phage terminase large subunit-like protein